MFMEGSHWNRMCYTQSDENENDIINTEQANQTCYDVLKTNGPQQNIIINIHKFGNAKLEQKNEFIVKEYFTN